MMQNVGMRPETTGSTRLQLNANIAPCSCQVIRTCAIRQKLANLGAVSLVRQELRA
jgi:hypothetical protein